MTNYGAHRPGSPFWRPSNILHSETLYATLKVMDLFFKVSFTATVCFCFARTTTELCCSVMQQCGRETRGNSEPLQGVR